MSTLIIAALLIAGIIGLLLWQRDPRQSAQRSTAPTSPQAHAITAVGPGGTLQLMRLGPGIEEMSVNITTRHIYREDGVEWFELEGECDGQKVWIEIEEEDGLAVSLSLRRLSLSEIGLDAAKLNDIERRDAGQIEFEGRCYDYEDWGEARFLEGGSLARIEAFKYWDFENDEDGWQIGIERWEDGEYQAYLSQTLTPMQYRVDRLGTENNAVN